jgi:hypothetical protein
VLQEAEIGKDLARYLNGRNKLAPRPEVMKAFELCQQLLPGDAPRPATTALNRLLTALSFSPEVQHVGGRPTVFWRPLKEKEFSSWIKIILDLMETGTLARVRQCICSKWFYAESNKKKVCSDACRARKFSEGTDRTEYMRAYRATLKAIAQQKGKKHS